MTRYSMWVLNSPYSNGSFRGIEKCSGINLNKSSGDCQPVPSVGDIVATLMFSSPEEALRYLRAMGSLGEFFKVFPIEVTVTGTVPVWMNDTEIDVLLSLDAVSSPAPWTVCGAHNDYYISTPDISTGGWGKRVLQLDTWKYTMEMQTDVDLICAMRNALPELLRLARIGLRVSAEQAAKDGAVS